MQHNKVVVEKRVITEEQEYSHHVCADKPNCSRRNVSRGMLLIVRTVQVTFIIQKVLTEG
jgi:hypothetical protein